MNHPRPVPVFLHDIDADFEIPVFTISSASAFERGEQYGTQARAQIDASIACYSRLFSISHGLDWSEVAERALIWEPIVGKYDADIADEIRGIAHGAGRELGEILALNARGEMVYAQFLKAEGCTSFALLADGNASGHAFAGQNWDWRMLSKDSRVILRIEQPPKPTITMVVEAGQVGRHGANSAGLAVFANGLPAKASELGVPQALIRRKVLDQHRFDRALEVVLGAEQQIPANVLIAHRDFAIDVETTPTEHRWEYPQDGVIAHANHFEYFQGAEYQPRLGADSLYRGYLMRQSLNRLRSESDVGAVLRGIGTAFANKFGHPNSIAAHPDPDEPEHLQWGTLSSSIVDLTEGTWYITDGPADTRAYRRLGWSVFDERI
ncbi:C45 family peptidase [Sphaerisporangium sp. NPDC051017]|uniref:C45 family peptidase n=1 Tax=Sphaerisporangium sp. NPDC051017 TaxID=3154636 RepID=UPI0034460DD1